MKKYKAIKILVFLVAFALISTGISLDAKALSISSQVRYSGSTRIETGVAVSKEGWSTSQNVVLAYAYDFPDALAGVSLAYKLNCPILLTETQSIPKATSDEMNRLGVKNVYILGGIGVISKNVENTLVSSGKKVIRLGGQDRFKTSIEITKNIDNLTHTAVIATANDFPDALAIAPYAAMKNIPILFTEANSFTSDTKNWVINNGIQNVIIPGGIGVVSASTENELKSLGINVQRISGDNRYLTNLNIVKTFASSFSNDVMLATGEDFPDALTGGVLAAKTKRPILLVTKTEIERSVQDYLDEKPSFNMSILGGTGVIPDDIKSLFRKVVVVDPGHDYGKDAGAVGNGYAETDLDMQVGLKVAQSLESQGYKVILTRQAWEKPASMTLNDSLQNRVNIANNANADLFISIHHDSDKDDTRTSGVSTHYSSYKPNIDNSDIVDGKDPGGWPYDDLKIDSTPSKQAILGRDLANEIVNKLGKNMGYNNLKAHDHGLYVTKNTNMGAVLIECGFLSNPSEAKRSADPQNQALLGQNIAQAVKEVLH
ncbi:cell wall-binding repeat-containing protein [Clostridium sp. 'White wine YQ']|uniref:cell wall-binding repeat-containing protein n=1 Tax=Clostridium sp. 'White wine YQ' TaxID=3027474 RepID=UPI002366D94C|nr:cell wall-binding repeat-containing protein [Clostridium sp. 'White wine YQ']MDD7794982.1 cell wall-binding repeat-containing protein [Clostridium sp. 'White wine YQ']